MRVQSCGLDFGTSNSTLGIADPMGAATLMPLEDGRSTIPSAIFYNFDDDKTYFGREAQAEYASGADGRMMRSLKSVLGTSLVKEATRVKLRRIAFVEIIGSFLGEMKRRTEKALDTELAGVVVGRPVHFNDDDPIADSEAQRQLEAIVKGLGFRHIAFQFEPIAAALDYEQTIGNEELAIVVDIGGGTSDFTIIRLSPERSRHPHREADILSTAGVHVGGTDFDQRLSMERIMPLLGMGSEIANGKRPVPVAPYFDLSSWHRINRLYTREMRGELSATLREAARPDLVSLLVEIVRNRLGHTLAGDVEAVKIALTEADEAAFSFASGRIEIEQMISVAMFESAIGLAADRIPKTIERALKDAQLPASAIETVVVTGGSTQIPYVRRSLEHLFGEARFVATDAFGSVGIGLALDAARRFG